MAENQVLNPQQAINILVQAVNLGQKAGVYSLDDAALIKQAVDIFVKKDDAKDAKEEEEEVKEPKLEVVKGNEEKSPKKAPKKAPTAK